MSTVNTINQANLVIDELKVIKVCQDQDIEKFGQILKDIGLNLLLEIKVVLKMMMINKQKAKKQNQQIKIKKMKKMILKKKLKNNQEQ